VRGILVAAAVGLAVTLLGTPLAIERSGCGVGQRIARTDRTPPREDGNADDGWRRDRRRILLSYLAAHLVLGGVTASGLLVLLAAAMLGSSGSWTTTSRSAAAGRWPLEDRKIVGQAIVAVVFAIVAVRTRTSRRTCPSCARRPGSRAFFVIWVFVILASSSNSVNLTDGLDGLASGSSIFVFSAYVFIAFWQFRHTCAFGAGGVLPGGSRGVARPGGGRRRRGRGHRGVLWWNAAPARISW